ncbi:hypothetical protein [Flavobacterium sp. HTF]|uniref:hypothetical protein n=1 Tax=Flavobacterium sp. HTF TaxID=2170732 RepID=UPI000D5DC5A7|nr:hypothetical protein [Flavobacterium sp. HTF]PWB22563.1 hypothetical protein DCO46_16935 [Flavobacterium sp. HTF]
MAFIEVTLYDSDEPCFIVTENIDAVYTIPGQTDTAFCIIKTNGGHEIGTKESLAELKTIIGIP